MNRPRKTDKHLPPCVYRRHGAYYHVKAGRWTRLGTELGEALAAYARLVGAAAQGGMPRLIEEALPHLTRGRAPGTVRQYTQAARDLARILVEFGPDQVLPKHVAAIKRAGAATPNATNRKLTVLRLVFAWALEGGLAESNPCIGIRRLPEARRDRLITPSEYAAIHAEAGPRLRVIMELCVLTGQRIGDVLAIRRDALTDEGIVFRQQKTGTPLVVRWSPELRAAVDCAKGLRGRVHALTLLSNRNGRAPDYSTVKLQWDRARRAAGVEDATLHDLRALAATLARRQGADATALLGHASEAMTRRYLRGKDAKVVNGPSFGRPIDSREKNK